MPYGGTPREASPGWGAWNCVRPRRVNVPRACGSSSDPQRMVQNHQLSPGFPSDSHKYPEPGGGMWLGVAGRGGQN